MAEDESEHEQEQQTPAGHTIPVPTREDVFRDLEKVARPKRERDDTES